MLAGGNHATPQTRWCHLSRIGAKFLPHKLEVLHITCRASAPEFRQNHPIEYAAVEPAAMRGVTGCRDGNHVSPHAPGKSHTKPESVAEAQQRRLSSGLPRNTVGGPCLVFSRRDWILYGPGKKDKSQPRPALHRERCVGEKRPKGTQVSEIMASRPTASQPARDPTSFDLTKRLCGPVALSNRCLTLKNRAQFDSLRHQRLSVRKNFIKRPPLLCSSLIARFQLRCARSGPRQQRHLQSRLHELRRGTFR
jgi:hypothetical protein